jgi:hypothetical protein
MDDNTKLHIVYNVTSKAARRYSSEVWILNRRYTKKLKAAQMNLFKTTFRPNQLG